MHALFRVAMFASYANANHSYRLDDLCGTNSLHIWFDVKVLLGPGSTQLAVHGPLISHHFKLCAVTGLAS